MQVWNVWRYFYEWHTHNRNSIHCVLFLMFKKKKRIYALLYTHVHIYMLKIRFDTNVDLLPIHLFSIKIRCGRELTQCYLCLTTLEKTIEQWVVFEESHGEELMSFSISKRCMTFDNVCTEEKVKKRRISFFFSSKKNNRKEWNINEQWAVNEMNNEMWPIHTIERDVFERKG